MFGGWPARVLAPPVRARLTLATLAAVLSRPRAHAGITTTRQTLLRALSRGCVGARCILWPSAALPLGRPGRPDRPPVLARSFARFRNSPRPISLPCAVIQCIYGPPLFSRPRALLSAPVPSSLRHAPGRLAEECGHPRRLDLCPLLDLPWRRSRRRHLYDLNRGNSLRHSTASASAASRHAAAAAARLVCPMRRDHREQRLIRWRREGSRDGEGGG